MTPSDDDIIYGGPKDQYRSCTPALAEVVEGHLQFFEELIDVCSGTDDPVDLVELVKRKDSRIEGVVLERKMSYIDSKSDLG